MKPARTLLPSRNSRCNRGFSLIEILFVIGLIALLLTLVVSNIGGIFGGQQEKIATIFVKQSVKLGLIPYKLDMGNYPNTEGGLKALIKAPTSQSGKWNGPYLEELPLDPWENAYQYRFPGTRNINGSKGYDVWSFGADGVASADDIGNW